MEPSRGDSDEEGVRAGPYDGEPHALEGRYQDDSDPGDLEVEERFPEAAQAGRASLERCERAAGAATRGASVSEVMMELQEDEDEFEDLEEKPAVKTKAHASVFQVAEVKKEPGMKEETGTSDRTEEEDGEFYDALEEPSSPKRSPSGFIPHYTGPEARRTDRPAFGWTWSAQRVWRGG
ncbi:hypothetical protein PR003_g28170 [Phytophthora rubi]|uniref:Uncharacterized protein n=1 Tax=Phytophthora rubi TaxID=129364 RepID=A0A6A4BUK9_9STRA|nr:hypothetical protein PR003_g28170 [Phytophthora rubi]